MLRPLRRHQRHHSAGAGLEASAAEVQEEVRSATALADNEVIRLRAQLVDLADEMRSAP